MIYFIDFSGNIWVVNSDGTGAVQIVTALAGSANGWEFVSVSPDGSQLLTSATDATYPNPESLYVMNVDGTGQTALSFLPSGTNGVWASWNPDGTKFAVAMFASLAWHVLIVDLAGSSYTSISVSTLSSISPLRVLWSPDGAKIAYPSNTSGGTVGVMNADGSGQHDLITAVSDPEYDPIAWFADSTNLLVSASYATSHDQHIIKTDGATSTTIYTDAGDVHWTPYAALSPDESAVAFADNAFTGVIDLLTIPGGVLTGLPSIGAGVNSDGISWVAAVPPPPINVGTPTTGIVRMGGFF